MMPTLIERAAEIAQFLNLPFDDCLARLSEGWFILHHAVTEDFRRADPKTEEELLDWYRNTDSYIYELSAYHLDPEFNYFGMCYGGATTLQAMGVKSVLCLGDGIGDLTLYLARMGFEATYHDLRGSRTALFAAARLSTYCLNPPQQLLTDSWDPTPLVGQQFDAVVSFDFLEHVPNIPEWATAIYACLNPGGRFFVVNRFATGSGPDGGMPMHLEVNDRYVEEWVPLLQGIGFEQTSGDWFVKKVMVEGR